MTGGQIEKGAATGGDSKRRVMKVVVIPGGAMGPQGKCQRDIGEHYKGSDEDGDE